VSTGLRLRVRLTPKSKRDAVDGIEQTGEGPALKVHVRAPPEKGKANAALVETVAGWLGVPKSSVDIVGGGKSRNKLLTIAGEPARLGHAIGTRLAKP
jgi:uncharacterized protein (TIGR00251 family)